MQMKLCTALFSASIKVKDSVQNIIVSKSRALIAKNMVFMFPAMDARDYALEPSDMVKIIRSPTWRKSKHYLVSSLMTKIGIISLIRRQWTGLVEPVQMHYLAWWYKAHLELS